MTATEQGAAPDRLQLRSSFLLTALPAAGELVVIIPLNTIPLRKMSTTEEIYPMPAFPTLEVKDLARSAQWYQDVLGFSNVFTMPGPGDQPSLIHLRWAKYADLLLRPEAHQASGGTKGRGVTLAFRVTSGTVDEVADRARRHGAKIVAEPEDKPWNAREFTVADPDGFRLAFTQGPLKEMEMDDVIAAVRHGQVENEK